MDQKCICVHKRTWEEQAKKDEYNEKNKNNKMKEKKNSFIRFFSVEYNMSQCSGALLQIRDTEIYTISTHTLTESDREKYLVVSLHNWKSVSFVCFSFRCVFFCIEFFIIVSAHISPAKFVSLCVRNENFLREMRQKRFFVYNALCVHFGSLTYSFQLKWLSNQIAMNIKLNWVSARRQIYQK